MTLKNRLFYAFLLFVPNLFSQNLKDSIVFAPLIKISYGTQLPGGDLAQRFGINSTVGLKFSIKTKKNLLFGVDGNYLFGKEVKEELFKNISNTDGNIINTNGEYAEIRLSQRGIAISAHVGKVIPVWGPNKNSGIISTLGLGYLQHKVRIDVPGGNVPQLAGDYKKGYDKLTSGLALTEFVGYLFLGNNRMLNFFGGFEFTQAFTKSRRTYDFDLKAKDNNNRTDLLYGFRIGWVLPLYKKMPNEYYYN